MPVYMIRAGDTDMVKIGWAFAVEARLSALQCAHYEKLSVIRVIECELAVEHILHRRFADRKVRGEWFQFVPEMLTISLSEIEQPPKPDPTAVIPLAHRIEDFLKSTGMSPTVFGRMATGDPALVRELRHGRECRRALRTKITKFIESRPQEPTS